MSDNKKLEQLLAAAQQFGAPVQRNEPLSEHTTFKVGGNCTAMIRVNSEECTAALFSAAKKLQIPCFVIGRGSNLLCDDRGYCGVIFKIGVDFAGLRLVNETQIEAQAGCLLSKLCTFAAEHALTGLEWAYGIPGTVGGAVYMNAGAYGGEIKDVIVSARHATYSGELEQILREDMKLGYRTSLFTGTDSVITSAVFGLQKGSRQEIEENMQHYLSLRKEKQPLEYPSAGSTFKRPEGQFAGKLIQESGLKGATVGEAQVSEKHSGFVINRGNATSEEINELIKKVQQTVLEKTGYWLACEVKYLPYTDGE